MKITWGGAAGFTAVIILLGFAVFWVATRPLLAGPYRTTPRSAVHSGWRAVFRLIETSPRFALALFGLKLFQSVGKDLQNIVLRHHPLAWSLTGIAIDLAFALAWAALALQISFSILAPDLLRSERRPRRRRAVVYAAGFWGLTLAVNAAGIALVVLVHGADHGKVVKTVGYIFYAISVVAALTRPAIAIGLPRPIKESFRIMRENWLGVSVTLILAVLPLAVVFISVGMFLRFFRLGLGLAFLLELPVAALSALCYLAFEGVIAAMYKRIM
jgi:hypothetical protein